MTDLLDTNICIDHLRRRGTHALRRKLQVIDPTEIAVCSVVVAELLAGCYPSQTRDACFKEVEELRQFFVSLPFDDAAAQHSGRVAADLESRGQRIGEADLFIAGVGIANDLTLLTNNIGEFSRVTGLRIEDWRA